ncbi:transcriptional regulator [bacterium]|nr:transcriptional regulator [bacterium]
MNDRLPEPRATLDALGPLAPAVRELLSVLRGRPSLVPFQEIQRQLHLTHMLDRGVREVPIDAITGSLGRSRDFDRGFLPRDEDRRRHLDSLRAMAEREGFPPIELYQVGEAYFVVDGHHRVALARQMGLAQIEAHVWEFPTDVAVRPGDDVPAVVAKTGRRNFQRATGLDDATVDALRTSDPAGYDRLLEHVAVHRYYLGLELRREPSWTEAVASWWGRVYQPLVDVVRQRELMARFPGRTETDLYLWVSEHLHRLREAYDDDALAPERAVPEVPRWRRWLARLWR